MTQPKGKCPQCSKPIDAAYRPFCSKRCADIDLHKWLNGRYAIPGAAEEDAPDGGEQISPNPKA
jgi:endogenous inhibitor of DNA gyrase (YacG/DUF329 family)